MGDVNAAGTGRAEFMEMSPLKLLQWISGSQRNETGLKKILNKTESHLTVNTAVVGHTRRSNTQC